MKLKQTIMCFVLGLSIVAVGCGKDKTPTQSEFDADNAAFKSAQTGYNTAVAHDSTISPQYSVDEKIAACDKYIANAEKMISKYPENKSLKEGKTVTGANSLKEDLAKVRAVRSEYVLVRDENNVEKVKVDKSTAEFKSFQDNTQVFETDFKRHSDEIETLRKLPKNTPAEIEAASKRAETLLTQNEGMGTRATALQSAKLTEYKSSRHDRQVELDKIQSSKTEVQSGFTGKINKMKEFHDYLISLKAPVGVPAGH